MAQTTVNISDETKMKLRVIAEIETRSLSKTIDVLCDEYYRTHCLECHMPLHVHRCTCKSPETI